MLCRGEYLAESLELDVHRGTETSSNVAGTGAEVSEALAPHELASLGLHQVLNLSETATEALEDCPQVAALLHGDDAAVVLLVDPDEERLLIVVPKEKERT
jgi:hypothetical protein